MFALLQREQVIDGTAELLVVSVKASGTGVALVKGSGAKAAVDIDGRTECSSGFAIEIASDGEL